VSVTVDEHYNFCASLERIACLAPDTNCMRDQAKTQNRLMVLYGITLPLLSTQSAQDDDVFSIAFFCMYIQGAAKKSSPLMVFANFSAVVPEFKVKFGTPV